MAKPWRRFSPVEWTPLLREQLPRGWTLAASVLLLGALFVGLPTSISAAPSVPEQVTVTYVAPSLETGSIGTWTFQYTNTVPIPPTTNLVFTFDSGFHLGIGGTGATVCSVQFTTGGAPTSVAIMTGVDPSGRTLTCSLTGTPGAAAPALFIPPNSQVTITATNVQLPMAVAASGPMIGFTAVLAGTVIEQATPSIGPIQLAAGPIADFDGQALTSAAGPATYEFSFSTPSYNPWPAHGQLRLILPSGYPLPTGPLTASFLGGCSGLLDAAAGLASDDVIVTISRSGDLDPSCPQASLQIGPLTNPASGSAICCKMEMLDANGQLMDLREASNILPSLLIGSNNAGAGFVGATDTFTLQLADPWSADGELLITLPAGFGANGPTATLQCGGPAVSASVSVTGQTLTLVRDGLHGLCAPGATVTAVVTGITNPHYAGDDLFPFTFDTASHQGGAIDHGTASTSVSPGSLTGTSVTASSLVAGAVTTYTFAFNMKNPWPADGQLELTFPAGYRFDSLQPTATSNCDGSFAVTKGTAQKVYVVRSGGSPCSGSGKQVVIGGVKNPGVSGTVSGSFLVNTTDGNEPKQHTIDVGSTVLSPQLTDGALALSAAPVPNTAGSAAKYVLTLTTSNDWPANGKLLVTFPSEIVPSSSLPVADLLTCNAGNAGLFTATGVNGQVVTLTRDGSGDTCVAGTQVVRINGITNPGSAMTTAVFGVTKTTTSSSTEIDRFATGPTVTILPNQLEVQGITLTNPLAGAQNVAYNFLLSTTNPVDANGRVLVSFPGGYDLSQAGANGGADTFTCGSGTPEVAGAANPVLVDTTAGTLVFTRPGTGASCPAGSVTLHVAGIRNPVRSGASGAFGVATQKAGGANVDANPNAAGPVITAKGVLSVTSITPVTSGDAVAGAQNARYQFTFHLSDPWTARGSLAIQFPAGYAFDGPAVASSGCAGVFQAAADGTLLVLSRTSGSSCSAGTYPLTVSGIRNGGVSGPTGDFALSTRDDSGADIDVDSSANDVVTLTPGVLTPTLWTAQDPSTSVTTSWTLTFQGTNPWPATGFLSLQLPSAFDLSSPSLGGSSACDGSDATPASVQVSGSSLVLERGPGSTTCPAGTDVTVQIDGVRNPLVAGPIGPFAASTTTEGGLAIDQGTVAAADIVPHALDELSVSAGDLTTAPSASSYTFTMTLTDPLPNNGVLVVTFPTGYGLPTTDIPNSGNAASCGPYTQSASGLVVRLTHAGGDCTGSRTFVVQGVHNPSHAGTETLSVATATSGGGVLESGSIGGLVIGPAQMPTTVAVNPSTLSGAKDTVYRFRLSAPNDLPADGAIRLAFPAGFDLSAAQPGTITNCSATAGSLSLTAETPTTLVLHRAGGAQTCVASATSPLEVQLSGLVNPASDGSYDIEAQTLDASLETIDQGVGTVTIGPNHPPVANPDSYSTAEDVPLHVAAGTGTLANDTDPEGSTLSSVLGQSPSADAGSLVLQPDGSFVFTPTQDFNGLATFTYRATDGVFLSDPATVTVHVTPVNDAPVAQPDSYTTSENTALNVAAADGVLANDTDVDVGETLTAVLASAPDPAQGSLSLAPDGSFVFTPTQDFNGLASFTYAASDGTLTSASTTVTILVGAVNSAPTISSISDQSVAHDTSTSAIPFTVHDVDNDVSTLTVTATSSDGSIVPPEGLTLGGSDASRTITATPAPGATGTTTITLTVSDGQASAPTSFVLSVVNDVPTITAIADRSIAENSFTAAIPFTLGDGDDPVEHLTVAASSADGTLVPAAGLVLGGTGLDRTLTVTPAEGRTGRAVITLQVSDGVLSATSSFALTVLPPASLVASGSASVSGTDAGAVRTLQVIVHDVAHQPVAGIVVDWAVMDGQGTLSAPHSTTDVDGIASVQFTTGNVPGANSVRATSDSVPSAHVDFSVPTVVGPASLDATVITADPAFAVADGHSTITITVTLKDAAGNDVTSSAGTVTLSTTGGSLSAVTDNSDGTYSAVLTTSTTSGPVIVSGSLGGHALANTLQVVFGAGDAIAFIASGPTSIGDVPAGAMKDVHVLVTDFHGNPVPDVTIQWAVSSGGGTLSAASSKSGADGIASITLTTPARPPGNSKVTASHASLTAPVVFTITTVAGPAALVTPQDATGLTKIGAGTAATLKARVADAHGNPIQGVVVTWAAPASDGTVTPTTSKTDATGNATTQFKTSKTVGTLKPTATMSGLPAAVFTVTTVPVYSLVSTTTATTVTAGQVALLRARLVDQLGQPVVGGEVGWSVTSGDGSLDNSTSLTGSDGNATASLTTATVAGPNAVKVANGSASLTLTIQGAPGDASELVVTGLPSSATVGASLAAKVQLRDANHNVVDKAGLVTLQEGAGPTGQLAGPGTATLVAGTAQVTGLRFNAVGRYILMASYGAMKGSSSPIDVAASSAAAATSSAPASPEAPSSVPSSLEPFFADHVDAQRLSNGSVLVNWTAPPTAFGEDVGGFLVWRAASPFVLIGQTGGANSTFVDSTALSNHTYRYAVTFFLASGKGLYEAKAAMVGLAASATMPTSATVEPAAHAESFLGATKGTTWVVVGLIAACAALVVVAVVLIRRRRAASPEADEFAEVEASTAAPQTPDAAAEPDAGTPTSEPVSDAAYEGPLMPLPPTAVPAPAPTMMVIRPTTRAATPVVRGPAPTVSRRAKNAPTTRVATVRKASPPSPARRARPAKRPSVKRRSK